MTTPLSRNGSIALVSEDTACVIVSWEHQIQCSNRTGHLFGVFGREGEGPGEFVMPGRVLRGPGRTVAVLDPGMSRLSVFTVAGELTSETTLPVIFMPLSPVGETLVGTLESVLPGSGGKLVAEVDPDGTVVWQDSLPNSETLGLPEHCGLGWGSISPSGVAAFPMCEDRILFFDTVRRQQVSLIRMPTFRAELPNARDIDAFREAMRFLYPNNVVPEAAVRDYAETPKLFWIRGWSMAHDARNRLWVGTTRDHDRVSWLDLYRDTTLLGSVRVRDRLVGFDVLGSTLVTLVERAPPERDAYAIPELGIDWYDVSSVANGLFLTASGEVWPKSFETVDTLAAYYALKRGDATGAPRRILLPESLAFHDATATHVWGIRRDPLGVPHVVGRRLVAGDSQPINGPDDGLAP